jgi:hypothetical protein
MKIQGKKRIAWNQKYNENMMHEAPARRSTEKICNTGLLNSRGKNLTSCKQISSACNSKGKSSSRDSRAADLSTPTSSPDVSLASWTLLKVPCFMRFTKVVLQHDPFFSFYMIWQLASDYSLSLYCRSPGKYTHFSTACTSIADEQLMLRQASGTSSEIDARWWRCNIYFVRW